jgi:hypothetical protein
VTTGVLAARQALPTALRSTGIMAAPVLAAAVTLGAVVSRSPALALVAAVAAALGTLVALRPPLAAYLLTGLTPLLVGIDRGRIVPVLRPNEALLVLCAAALLARGVWNVRTGQSWRPGLGLLAASLVAMAVSNSVVPLLAMALRGAPISDDDISYAMVLWKYLALYAVIRVSVRTEAEALRCVWTSIAASAAVAVIAVMQSLDLLGVEAVLTAWYAPFGDSTLVSNNRGSATLGLAAATADLMIFNLGLVAGLWRNESARRWLLAGVAALLVAGTLASGQFSAAIGLVVAIVVIGLVFRRSDVPIALVLVTAAAAWPLRLVIATRLSGFDKASGLPESWVGRLNNLQNYFWPRLFSDYNYLLGVQPSARVPSPQSLALPWVWIESGYTWLLWGGGIPLLTSFVLFVWVATRDSWRMSRRRDAWGACATAVFIAVPVVAVLMLFDPHITYRGSGDLLFTLLAVLAAGAVGIRNEAEVPATRHEAGGGVRGDD